MLDLNADLDNLFSASTLIEDLVNDNAYSLARPMVITQFTIPAMLYPPLPHFHYLQDWLPMLAEKARLIDQVVAYAKSVSSEQPAGSTINLAETARIATIGLYMYEKMSMYGGCDWDDCNTRSKTIRGLPGLALLILRFTSLWSIALISVLSDASSVWGLAAELSRGGHWQALEIRLCHLGLSSVVPSLTGVPPNVSTDSQDLRDFVLESYHLTHFGSTTPLELQRYIRRDQDLPPVYADRYDLLMTRRMVAHFPDEDSRYFEESQTNDAKLRIQGLIRELIGSRSDVQVMEEFVPVLKNGWDEWSVPAFEGKAKERLLRTVD